MELNVASMVVSLSFVDLEKDEDLESWGRRTAKLELLNPVDYRNLFFLVISSLADWETRLLDYRKE
jgi:hypothetical protein